MGMERKAREALERHGAKEHSKKAGDFEDKLAQAADDVGRSGGRKEAEKFIDAASRIVGRSAQIDREMRRPDLHPQYDTDPNRRTVGQVGPSSKKYFYPGKKRA